MEKLIANLYSLIAPNSGHADKVLAAAMRHARIERKAGWELAPRLRSQWGRCLAVPRIRLPTTGWRAAGSLHNHLGHGISEGNGHSVVDLPLVLADGGSGELNGGSFRIPPDP